MTHTEKLCKLAALHSILFLHHFEPFLINDVLSRDYEKEGLQENNLVKLLSESSIFRFGELVYSEEDNAAYIATNPAYFHFGDEFKEDGPNELIGLNFQQAISGFLELEPAEFRAIFGKPGEGLEALERDEDNDYTFLVQGEYDDEQELLETRIAQFLLNGHDDRFQDILSDTFAREEDYSNMCINCSCCED